MPKYVSGQPVISRRLCQAGGWERFQHPSSVDRMSSKPDRKNTFKARSNDMCFLDKNQLLLLAGRIHDVTWPWYEVRIFNQKTAISTSADGIYATTWRWAINLSRKEVRAIFPEGSLLYVIDGSATIKWGSIVIKRALAILKRPLTDINDTVTNAD